jgi:hypothetical protein
VTLEIVEGAVLEQVDAAYHDKYGRYAQSIIDGITNDQARATTLRLVALATR